MTVNPHREPGGWRARVPVLLVVLACVAGVTAAVTGAASPVNSVQFLAPGHWVFNVAFGAAFHVDGATGGVDAAAEVPGERGSQVVQGDTSGYVVGDSRITVFGKSSLEVVESRDAPAREVPVPVEIAGGPYLVYRDAGIVVRLGEHPLTLSAGDGLGDPVATSDGTLWLPRVSAGLICQLPAGAERISCPVAVEGSHHGALAVVRDRPMFVDTSTDRLHPIESDGLGAGRALGVDVPDSARVAANDVSGRIAILDPDRDEMHLIDAAAEPTAPVRVDLAEGEYDGPMSTGTVVAVVDRGSDTVTTYDGHGERRSRERVPAESGDPRLARGEDDRIYVDGADGEHVLVVDKDGKTTAVPIRESAPDGDRPDGEPDKSDKPDAREPRGSAPDGDRADQPARPRKPRPPERKPDVRAEEPPPRQQAPPKDPPPVPATSPGAPPAVNARPGNASATVSWGAAAANRAPITGYTVRWAGGSRTLGAGARGVTVNGLTNGTAYTFTVSATNAVGTGPGASASPVTPVAPAPSVVLARGGDTSSDSCAAPDCSWLHVTMTNFAPNTTYTITGVASDWGDDFSEPAVMTTNANGAVTFEDTRFDGPGQQVWVVVDTPAGPVESNHVYWAPRTSPSTPKVTLSRGPPTDKYCGWSPDCAWMHVELTGFEADTDYEVEVYSSDPAYSNEGAGVHTDENGFADTDRFAYAGVGHTVWVEVTTPDGPVKSNELPWGTG